MFNNSIKSVFCAFSLLALMPAIAFAAPPTKDIKFNYRDSSIVKVLDDYSKASGQRFIISPNVKGKITIINPAPIDLKEAFDQLSTALAANGVGISTQDGVMYVASAREIQRNYIPVVTQVPPIRPQRMVTMVFKLKHISADTLNKELRILSSRDGEEVPYLPTNSIIISDWTPNVARVAKIIEQLDQPAGPDKKTHH
jgi:general secretion pathway protein D